MDSRKYSNDSIHANHMEMCRFQDENADGYEKFFWRFEEVSSGDQG